jgi:hypothetical protein
VIDTEPNQPKSRARVLTSSALTLVAIFALGMLVAACAWFDLFPLGGGGQVNNVFSNISNGLSQ